MIIQNNFNYKNFCELTSEEQLLVLQWRNHKTIRKWMINKEFITINKHKTFLMQLHNNNEKKYWLVMKGTDPVGVSSLTDIKNRSAEWGYYLAPEYHETSLAIEFYYFTLDYLFNFIKLEMICGFELVNNQNASSLNSLFGFTKEKTTKAVNGIQIDLIYRKLSKRKWIEKIKKDKKILKLLNFALSRSL